MASVAVCTPVKKSHVFSVRVAGGRIPLTPSPKTPTPATSNSSGVINFPSIHSTPTFVKPICRGSALKKSSKHTIVPLKSSPKRLDLGISEWSLTGTGASARISSCSSSQRNANRPKPGIRIPYQSADRFIPNREASEGIRGVAAGQLQFPKSKTGRFSTVDAGSAILADRAADAFGIAGDCGTGFPGSPIDDATLSFEGLALSDNRDRHQSATTETMVTHANNDSLNSISNNNINAHADVSSDNAKSNLGCGAYESSLANACGFSLNTRILAFKPAPPDSSRPIDLRSHYNRPLKPASSLKAQQRRRILTSPERVLDAPNIVDDYYLNLLDWSCNNQVAIGLDKDVYIWSASSGNVSKLLTMPDSHTVTSLKWSPDGAYVSVGAETGEVQIWDVGDQTKLRSMFGHESRVASMAWSKHILSTGARNGWLFNHDVRIAEHKVASLESHTGEVCGLDWRSDGNQLASGGNDNLVSIWDARSLQAPKFAKTNHNAAVKAIAWCPWQLNLLATGGGTRDRHIHFWNGTTGARVNSIDTGSQVTSLRWSTIYKEIASTSGFPDNSISVWSYPSLVRNVEIPAHESRVLHSSLSPDGQTLATAAADENLKFWKLFEKKTGSTGAGGNLVASGILSSSKSVGSTCGPTGHKSIGQAGMLR